MDWGVLTMRGMELVFPFNFTPNIEKLLSGIPIEHFRCIVPDGTVYRNGVEAPLPTELRREDISALSQRGTVILRMILQFFEPDSDVCGIETYEDFLSSGCALLMLIYDSHYVEVYSKHDCWLSQIQGNVRNVPGIVQSVKSGENDSRTKLYV